MLTYADSIIKLLFLFIKLLPGNFIIYKLFLLSTLANCVCLMILAHLALKLCFLFQESELLSTLKKKRILHKIAKKKEKRTQERKGEGREERREKGKREREGMEGGGGSRGGRKNSKLRDAPKKCIFNTRAGLQNGN